MAVKVICATCGGLHHIGRATQHLASKWHRVAIKARNYHKVGVSFAEIGRQLGLSRYYVAKKLHEENAYLKTL